ncbi:MAG TPA: hypothetical protein VNF07_11730 [Acidimicrobiales bacterium]|nr:hypothetical protein [Acidimicrobiales bacterium]
MATSLDGFHFGSTFRLLAWEDPVGEVAGVDPRSSYVTRYWLPFLGPSTTLLLGLLAARLDALPAGCEPEVAELAFALGLGQHPGRHGPLLRAVARAVDFRLAAVRGAGTLAVRRHLPPLPARLAARLPEGLAAEHAALLSSKSPALPLDALARRGRQLALSLLELGESADEAERQLLRWRFPPPLARHCARWAAAQRAGADDPAGLAAVLVSKPTGTGR